MVHVSHIIQVLLLVKNIKGHPGSSDYQNFLYWYIFSSIALVINLWIPHSQTVNSPFNATADLEGGGGGSICILFILPVPTRDKS